MLDLGSKQNKIAVIPFSYIVKFVYFFFVYVVVAKKWVRIHFREKILFGWLTSIKYLIKKMYFYSPN